MIHTLDSLITEYMEEEGIAPDFYLDAKPFEPAYFDGTRMAIDVMESGVLQARGILSTDISSDDLVAACVNWCEQRYDGGDR